MKQYKRSLGTQIRLAREKVPFTQEHLAKVLKIATDTLSKYEKDKRIPPPNRIAAIEEACHVTLHPAGEIYYIEGEGEDVPQEVEKDEPVASPAPSEAASDPSSPAPLSSSKSIRVIRQIKFNTGMAVAIALQTNIEQVLKALDKATEVNMTLEDLRNVLRTYVELSDSYVHSDP